MGLQTIIEKLEILADAAKYDASCASSGTAKRNSAGGKGIGSTEGMGICHAYAPDGRCISLLKILLTNFCSFDCVFCINRSSSNVRRARFSVEVKGGRALVIDEAYNANPASMRVTLAVLGEEAAIRKIAVLGEMRELGDKSDDYHAALAGPVRDAGVQLVILVGEKIQPLAEALEGQVEIVHVSDAAAARDRLMATLEAGDAVLIKGSNGVGLAAVVAALAGGKL